MEQQFKAALQIQPFIIANGREDGWIMPDAPDHDGLLHAARALEPGRDQQRADAVDGERVANQ